MDIQKGIYCFYPPSCVSCHVSMTPNQQTLRDAPLATRFNVATFGVLGYELDFGELTPDERRQIKRQIAFYKAHRKTLQYGRLACVDAGKERAGWQISRSDETIAAIYNLEYHTSPARDTLRVLGTEKDATYTVKTVEQRLKISRFGSLIKHVFPITVKADGALMRFVNAHFSMKDGVETYTVTGAGLESGIPLAMQYSGSGYHKDLRLLGDWGSTLYLIEKTENEKGTIQNG